MVDGSVYISLDGSDRIKLNIVNGTLNIPEEINNKPIDKIVHIDAMESDLLKIEKIIINAPLNYIGNIGILFNAKNLKTLVFNNDDININLINDFNDFEIERICITKRIGYAKTFEITSKMENSREFHFARNIIWYDKWQFANNLNLNPSWVLWEGLQRIEMGAFENCQSLRILKLPKSLRQMDVNAFIGCENIERVEFNSYVALSDDYNNLISGEIKLFDQSPNVTVVCPVDYPVNYLKQFINEDANIAIDKNKHILVGKYYNQNSINEKINLFGMRDIVKNVPSSKDRLVLALKLMDKEMWERQVINHVIGLLNEWQIYNCSSLSGIALIGDGIFFTEVNLDINAKMEVKDFWRSNIQHRLIENGYIEVVPSRVDIVNNMCVIDFGNLKVEFIIDLDYIANCIERNIKSDWFYVVKKRTSLTNMMILNMTVSIDYK